MFDLLKKIQGIDTEIYDTELIHYLNSGIDYLKSNNIPVDLNNLNSSHEDYNLILDYLNGYVSIRFEKDLADNVISEIKSQMLDTLLNLKGRYDVI